jgi:hypothetical protein
MGLINKHSRKVNIQKLKERTVYCIDDIPSFVVLDKIEIATLPNIQHSPSTLAKLMKIPFRRPSSGRDDT